MNKLNKRIFDTDNALKGSFNGKFGKWQLLSYSLLTLAFAIVSGWLNKLGNYTLRSPTDVDCEGFEDLYGVQNLTNRSLIQRLTGRDKYEIIDSKTNNSIPLVYNYSNNFTLETIITEYKLFCDLNHFGKLPRFAHLIGFICGAILLGILADKGGRKIILLGCIWVTGVMSLFQIVGHEFISYLFFQLFLSIFSGGVHAVFLPKIIEMFPINLRTFYGTLFHLVVAIFEVVLPLIALLTKKWALLQKVTTAPLILTAPLQWIAFETIFWYLAHKEYDKAIKTLTELAKRNGILFESKFKQAKEFLHAKHSKGTQVDIMPLLRLKDVESLGKKYPTVDMAELQKQKLNNSKLRRFLNSLKGNHYRSTNTIYHPFDFIYSPVTLIYVLILCGLWFTNGLSMSIESIRKDYVQFNDLIQDSLINLVYIGSSILAIALSLIKISRRWMIFLAYLIMEICLLGSLISKYNTSDHMDKTNVALNLIYFFCKFSTHFGFIFLMLITAEIFPTSLRCTGMGICFTFKMCGELLVAPYLLAYNNEMHRLIYGLFTLLFGALALFLPETRKLPLPRTIAQIEGMQTTIGEKFRSRKVKLAYEKCVKIQKEYREDSKANNNDNMNTSRAHETSLLLNNNNLNESQYNEMQQRQTLSNRNSTSNTVNNNPNGDSNKFSTNYDTVTSVHDIEQDSHVYVYSNPKYVQENYNSRLPNIAEVPSKALTRSNSMNDNSENSKC